MIQNLVDSLPEIRSVSETWRISTLINWNSRISICVEKFKTSICSLCNLVSTVIIKNSTLDEFSNLFYWTERHFQYII